MPIFRKENTVERDDLIVQMFHELRGMIYNFARRHNLDFDDCLQDASLIMLEVWERIPAECSNIKAYLNGTVRRQLYKLLSSRCVDTLSLDAPVAEDSDETFADMLQAFVSAQDEKRADFVEQVTHAALKQCRLEEQMYARERFGLNSFNPIPSNWSYKPNYGRTKDSMCASIKRNFSRNPQVLALIR
jgi:hypothetical protein